MGLFDKFKKRIKDSKIESDITAGEDTKEAKNAILDRKEKLNNIQIQNKDKQIDQNSNKVIEEEWDDIPDKSITNPFYDKHNSKERKFAKRAKSMENNVKKTQLTKVIDNMHTTTGKKLIPKTTVKFHFDFANEEVKRGGRIIKGGPVFDEILEELNSPNPNIENVDNLVLILHKRKNKMSYMINIREYLIDNNININNMPKYSEPWRFHLKAIVNFHRV
jgi:hypothetical protein